MCCEFIFCSSHSYGHVGGCEAADDDDAALRNNIIEKLRFIYLLKKIKPVIKNHTKTIWFENNNNAGLVKTETLAANENDLFAIAVTFYPSRFCIHLDFSIVIEKIYNY